MTSFAVLSHRDVASELGHIGTWLESRDARVARIFREDSPDLPDVDALIVLGSPTSVADGHCRAPARREIELIASWIASNRPYLGVCFGAQALACAAGGSVRRMNDTFRAYTEVTTEHVNLGGRWAVWHEDAISAPGGSIASLPHADAAFRLGRAWGVQPHIEFTSDIVERLARAFGVDDGAWRPMWEALRDDEAGHERRTHRLLGEIFAD
ncbi:MAG: hypothetical protein RLZZ269_271 [Actinomycetota bacterium]